MRLNRSGVRRGALQATLVLGIASLVAGCSTSPFDLSASAVRDHRAAWEALGLTDYEFDVHRQCECSADWVRPARVVVRGGRVVEATYADSGQPAAASMTYPTIDELFDMIEEAIRLEAPGLWVSYDPRLEYPTDISINYQEQVVDDEISISAKNLVAR